MKNNKIRILYYGVKDKEVEVNGGVYVVAKNVFDNLNKKGIKIDAFPLNCYKESKMNFFIYYIRFYLQLLKIYYKYLTNQYDIIHFNQVTEFNKHKSIFNLHKYPIIQNVHGLPTVEQKYHKYGSDSEFRLFKIRIKSATKIIVNSNYMKNELCKMYSIPKKKIILIQNGIQPIKKKSYIKLKGKIKLLFVGRLSYEKGILLLLEAFGKLSKEIKGLHLHIVGIGPLFNKIKILIDNKNLCNHVTLHGFIPQNKIPKYYNSCDFFISPSIYEPFGIMNLEAMRSQIPIITSNVGGIPEIIKDNFNGIIIKPSVKSIYTNFKILYNTPNLIKLIKRNQLNSIKKYYWEKVVDEIIDIYKILVDNNHICAYTIG